jgi:hypothetical protein
MGVDFTLSDLTNDMIVGIRDGTKYLVISDGKIMMGFNGWNKFENYDNDLTNRDYFNLNIDKVWKITSEFGYTSLGSLLTDNYISRMIECGKIELVFDRNAPKAPKVKKMTVQQICDELGYEVEIVKE